MSFSLLVGLRAHRKGAERREKRKGRRSPLSSNPPELRAQLGAAGSKRRVWSAGSALGEREAWSKARHSGRLTRERENERSAAPREPLEVVERREEGRAMAHGGARSSAPPWVLPATRDAKVTTPPTSGLLTLSATEVYPPSPRRQAPTADGCLGEHLSLLVPTSLDQMPLAGATRRERVLGLIRGDSLLRQGGQVDNISE